jgi:predicted ATPase
MIFGFNKLASLRNATLDLRQFTVVIGKNNTNKTYMAYSVYALLDGMNMSMRLNNLVYTRDRFENTISFKFEGINLQIIKEAISESTRKTILNLSNFFQESKKFAFEDSVIDVSFTDEEIRLACINAADKLVFFNFFDFELERIWSEEDATLHLRMKKNPKNQNNLELDLGNDSTEEETDRTLQLVQLLSYFIVQELAPSPFALPAERNSLILTYQTLFLNRYDLLSSERNSIAEEPMLPFKKDTSFLPKPIEDYLDFLIQLTLNPKRRQNRNSIRSSSENFRNLAELLISKLYSGTLVELRDDSTGSKQIVLRLDDSHEIEFHNASTSIKQLTSLVFYLQYKARPGSFLIIDEPEMNLHPESQAILVEILAILSTLGVRVLLTTHSPYVLAHLNNLIASNQTNSSDRLFLKDKRAAIPLSNVSAYEIEKGSLTNLKDEEFGISWQSLSDVSSDLQNRLFQIYDTVEK